MDLRATLLFTALLTISSHAQKPTLAADTLTWKEHKWIITNGAMAGLAKGKSTNVFVDQSGYLHLKITKDGGAFTAAELFSQDNLGFGTYQWQMEGPIDKMDPATVLGLFLYGPANGIGEDGHNELDIEFSKWGSSLCAGHCNADFTLYPAPGPTRLGSTENDFHINLHGHNLLTARLLWTSSLVTATVMSGLQPLGNTKHVLHTWTFAPRDYLARIPQEPVPVGVNLWCFKKMPGIEQEVILRDFQFVPANEKSER